MYNVSEFWLMIDNFVNKTGYFPDEIKLNSNHFKSLYKESINNATMDLETFINRFKDNIFNLLGFHLKLDENIPDFQFDIITKDGQNIRLAVLTDDERMIKDIIE